MCTLRFECTKCKSLLTPQAVRRGQTFGRQYHILHTIVRLLITTTYQSWSLYREPHNIDSRSAHYDSKNALVRIAPARRWCAHEATLCSRAPAHRLLDRLAQPSTTGRGGDARCLHHTGAGRQCAMCEAIIRQHRLVPYIKGWPLRHRTYPGETRLDAITPRKGAPPSPGHACCRRSVRCPASRR